MRIALAVAGLAALAACAPTVPDSGAGVGFDSYGEYEAQRALREAELTGSQPGVATSSSSGTSTAVISSEELAAAGLPAASASTSGSSAVITPAAPATTTTAEGAAAIDVNHPGISDENDFQAVAARETIESDRERIEQNAAVYTVIEPTAVPERPGSADPNIAAYALSTTNQVGQKLYSRSTFNAAQKYQRACASYASSDLAQIDFLRNGGPERDRKGVDPDGDGFACAWDPTPFRVVVEN